ncbi:MAG: 30S ribosomal protein S20 [Planctomycetota bacterium]|nr:MAG: 30S ribosomal protein S20 [Planctomycetota bacterium]
MAHSKSAKKRIRQNEKRRLHNKALRSAAKTAIKKVMSAIEEGNLEEAKKLLPYAQKKIDKACKRNVIHKNNGARKKSRLYRLVQSISESKEES